MTDQIYFPKGDLRRMLAVLGAIDALSEATLLKIADRTGLDKKTVTQLIQQASAQAHVHIKKTGPVYTIVDWGPVIKRTGAKQALSGELTLTNLVETKKWSWQ